MLVFMCLCIFRDLGKSKKIEDGKSFIFMGNDDKALIERVGTYTLELQDNKIAR